MAMLFDSSGKHKLVTDIVAENFDVEEKYVYEPQLWVTVIRSASSRPYAREAVHS
jgi:hypothetical protein